MNYQGHIVDAVNREIFDGILSVENGRIVEVKRCELPKITDRHLMDTKNMQIIEE